MERDQGVRKKPPDADGLHELFEETLGQPIRRQVIIGTGRPSPDSRET